MNDPTQVSIYQLRAVLNGVSPLVWRRFLLSIETSLADLHKILQVAFGWSDFYLYEFCHSWEKHLARMQKIPAPSAWVTFSCARLNAFAIGTTFWHFGNPICVWKQLFRFTRI
jgi:Plasmid pRiA4b ORF-3-like protein